MAGEVFTSGPPCPAIAGHGEPAKVHARDARDRAYEAQLEDDELAG